LLPLAGLRAHVFLVVRGVALGVELDRPLYVFDGRPGPGMLGGAISLNGGVIFGPVNELLSETRVLELLAQLFWFHEIVLKLLHILKYLLTINKNYTPISFNLYFML